MNTLGCILLADEPEPFPALVPTPKEAIVCQDGGVVTLDASTLIVELDLHASEDLN